MSTAIDQRSEWAQLRDGAATQLRVIHALILRETRTRFGRYRLGYLWAVLEPLMFMGVFYLGFRLVGRNAPNNMDIVPFLATGILAFFLFRRTANQVTGAIGANKALLFYPQVQTLDLVAARGILEACTYTLVFFALVGTHAVATDLWEVDSLLRTVTTLGLTGLLAIGFGLVLSALQVFWEPINHFLMVLNRTLFWTSGLFFTANQLPTRAREFLLYNPLLHCTELLRDAWFLTYTAHHASLPYLAGWILALTCIGLHLERTARPKIRS